MTRSIFSEALEARVMLAFSANVNFQPANAAIPPGYLPDSGAVFASRGNGLSYGWNATNNTAVDRNSNRSPDQRYDTLIHMQQGGNFSWELAVPVGTYTVRVVAGDPSSTDGSFRINAEGSLALVGKPKSNARWIEGSAYVSITDGRLTITNASGASGNKINFVEVRDAVPLSPTNVTATAVSGRRVDVQWVDNANNETGYRVERSSDGGSNFVTLANLGASVTSFVDNTVTPSTSFIYRVTAFNAVGDSLSRLSPAVVTPSDPELAPDAPSNLRFSLSGTSVTLTWNDNSDDETKFVVEQQGGFFAGFTPIAETAANQTSVTVAVNHDVPVKFRVKASNAQGGDSSYSNVVDVLAVPAAPSNLQAFGVTTTSVRINWQSSGATNKTFTVQRLVQGSWTTVGTTTDHTFLEQNLPPNSTHRYRVIAANATGPSAPSAAVIGSTLLPKVTGLRATGITNNSISLAWDDVGGERSFRIERSTDGVNFTTVATTVANQTSFTDTGLPGGTQFTYRVSALMFNGDLAPASDPLLVVTL